MFSIGYEQDQIIVVQRSWILEKKERETEIAFSKRISEFFLQYNVKLKDQLASNISDIEQLMTHVDPDWAIVCSSFCSHKLFFSMLYG